MDIERLNSRYGDLQRYVGWTDADARRVEALRPLLEPYFHELIDDFYDEISRHEAARSVITGGAAQVDRLKQTLGGWLADLLSGVYDRAYVQRRWRVGRRHVEIGLDQVYTNAALSRLRTGLVRAMMDAWRGTPEEMRESLQSLHKLLDLDLAIIEDAYQSEYSAALHDEIAERRRAENEMQLLKDLALSIGASTSLDEAMRITLQRICEATGWDCGEVWLADTLGESRSLRLGAWHAGDARLEPFGAAARTVAFEPGCGLPGRVWQAGEPIWMDDLTDERRFFRTRSAAAVGLNAGLGVPVLITDDFAAVMTFFVRSRREEDERLLRLVVAAIAPLMPVVQRKRVEDDLARHRQQLEQIVEQRTAELTATHQQLRQADRLASIGTLAAGLGHDMNNVLLPVRARLDVLDAANLSEKSQNHLNAIRRSVTYLQKLSDALHLLALDPEDEEASGEATDLHQWWEQVGSLLLKTLPRHVRFQHDIPPGIPEAAVQPHRLTQAVLNLVVNAGEAIPASAGMTGDAGTGGEAGEVTLWADVAADPGGPGSAEGSAGRPAGGAAGGAAGDPAFVRLGVSDTGEGMSDDVRQRAFDPFFTTRKRGLGTGLGLSLVRSVVQAARGSIEIDSQPGVGTTVTLTFPVADRRAGDPSAPGSAGESAAARLAIVSVNDDRIASFVEALLSGAGFRVRRDAAGARSDAQPPAGAVWVVDPGTVSLSLVKQYLRADRQRRVILLGAQQEQWMSLGASVIEDPFDLDAIRAVIEHVA